MSKAAKINRSTIDQVELRQWCIEQAARWPMVNPYAGGQLGYQQIHSATEVDLLGRAERIFAWVTKQ